MYNIIIIIAITNLPVSRSAPVTISLWCKHGGHTSAFFCAEYDLWRSDWLWLLSWLTAKNYDLMCQHKPLTVDCSCVRCWLQSHKVYTHTAGNESHHQHHHYHRQQLTSLFTYWIMEEDRERRSTMNHEGRNYKCRMLDCKWSKQRSILTYPWLIKYFWTASFLRLHYHTEWL